MYVFLFFLYSLELDALKSLRIKPLLHYSNETQIIVDLLINMLKNMKNKFDLFLYLFQIKTDSIATN